ncbi:MAG: hypothetical protein QG615_259, partial [Nitrospirota bacterium]|nr:hypothetical protein [Nitrospirota bacterium]
KRREISKVLLIILTICGAFPLVDH